MSKLPDGSRRSNEPAPQRARRTRSVRLAALACVVAAGFGGGWAFTAEKTAGARRAPEAAVPVAGVVAPGMPGMGSGKTPGWQRGQRDCDVRNPYRPVTLCHLIAIGYYGPQNPA